VREIDYWQDQFPESWTCYGSADSRVGAYLDRLDPPIFGDTLTCRGVVDNMEVYFVFRMARVGPFQATTHPFFTTWFPGVTGGAWKEARMDTAEVTSVSGNSTEVVKGSWMCAFEENDPVRIANALPECKEVLPNNVFECGTRIEYFLKARYIGSSDWFLLPDTTGARYEEFEILPTLRTGSPGSGWCGSYETSVKWPCLLVADHFARRGNGGETNSDRIIRALRALNVPFDIFHKLGPASDQRNGIGRWAANSGQIGELGTDKYNWGPGATFGQFLAYKSCLLNAGDIYNYSMYPQDASMINNWLIYSDEETHRFFWVSGDQVLRCLYNDVSAGRALLRNILGVTYSTEKRNYSVFTGDYTYCLPLNFSAGGRLSECTNQYVVRMNGCSRAFNVLDVYSSVDSARVERVYDSQQTPAIACKSNSVLGANRYPNYKTLAEGYDNCLIRSDASLGPLACGDDSFLTQWIGCVLAWGSVPEWIIGGIETTTPPVMVTSLGQAFPNPMNPAAKISFSVAKSGKVSLRIFDVSGRLVRTLVDENKLASPKPYEIIWDGTNDQGETVSSGVFFYQLETAGFRSAKKIVILR